MRTRRLRRAAATAAALALLLALATICRAARAQDLYFEGSPTDTSAVLNTPVNGSVYVNFFSDMPFTLFVQEGAAITGFEELSAYTNATLDMSGGTSASTYVYFGGTLLMSGGSHGYLDVYRSTLRMSGGSASYLSTYAEAPDSITVSGGTITEWDSYSAATLSGGAVGILNTDAPLSLLGGAVASLESYGDRFGAGNVSVGQDGRVTDAFTSRYGAISFSGPGLSLSGPTAGDYGGYAGNYYTVSRDLGGGNVVTTRVFDQTGGFAPVVTADGITIGGNAARVVDAPTTISETQSTDVIVGTNTSDAFTARFENAGVSDLYKLEVAGNATVEAVNSRFNGFAYRSETEVYDNATLRLSSGSYVEVLDAYGQARIEATDSEFFIAQLFENSTGAFTDTDFDSLDLSDAASATVTGGRFTFGASAGGTSRLTLSGVTMEPQTVPGQGPYVSAAGGATLSLLSGSYNGVFVMDESNLEIFGGTYADVVEILDDALFSLYGTDIQILASQQGTLFGRVGTFFDLSGSYGSGGDPFTMRVFDEEGGLAPRPFAGGLRFGSGVAVPEPGSLLLLASATSGAAAIAARRRRQR